VEGVGITFYEGEIDMAKGQMKMGGIGCLVICAICIFAAIERYNTNARSVRAWIDVRPSSPFEEMMGGVNLKPGIPTATKYAVLFAVISGIGGVVLLRRSD
jgi:hypothetical protein